MPLLLVHDDARHGVAAYEAAVADAVARLTGTDAATTLASIVDAPRPAHVHFTDRLWADSPSDAAALFERLAAAVPALTVTLHDLPQPSDGERNLPRRADAYRRVVAATAGAVVNSAHEAALLTEFVGATADAVIPLPVDIRPPAPRPAPRNEAAIIGFFYPGKGHAEVVAAAAALARAEPSDATPVPRLLIDGAADPDRDPASPSTAGTLVDRGEHRSSPSSTNVPTVAGPGGAEPTDAAAAALADARLAEVRLADARLGVASLGAASPGHEGELQQLIADAAAEGIRMQATGYLDDETLLERCRAAAVPVAAHQHVSASGSIATWIAAGRRPLVPDTRYSREMADLRPGTLTVYPEGGLADAIGHALRHPESTWIAEDAVTGPGIDDVARAYLAWWAARTPEQGPTAPGSPQPATMTAPAHPAATTALAHPADTTAPAQAPATPGSPHTPATPANDRPLGDPV